MIWQPFHNARNIVFLSFQPQKREPMNLRYLGTFARCRNRKQPLAKCRCSPRNNTPKHVMTELLGKHEKSQWKGSRNDLLSLLIIQQILFSWVKCRQRWEEPGVRSGVRNRKSASFVYRGLLQTTDQLCCLQAAGRLASVRTWMGFPFMMISKTQIPKNQINWEVPG